MTHHDTIITIALINGLIIFLVVFVSMSIAIGSKNKRAAAMRRGPKETTIVRINTDPQDFIRVHGISVETAKWYSNTEFLFPPGYEMVLRRLNPHEIAVIRRAAPDAQAPG